MHLACSSAVVSDRRQMLKQGSELPNPDPLTTTTAVHRSHVVLLHGSFFMCLLPIKSNLECASCVQMRKRQGSRSGSVSVSLRLVFPIDQDVQTVLLLIKLLDKRCFRIL